MIFTDRPRSVRTIHFGSLPYLSAFPTNNNPRHSGPNHPTNQRKTTRHLVFAHLMFAPDESNDSERSVFEHRKSLVTFNTDGSRLATVNWDIANCGIAHPSSEGKSGLRKLLWISQFVIRSHPIPSRKTSARCDLAPEILEATDYL